MTVHKFRRAVRVAALLSVSRQAGPHENKGNNTHLPATPRQQPCGSELRSQSVLIMQAPPGPSRIGSKIAGDGRPIRAGERGQQKRADKAKSAGASRWK